jgi:hypothetical protein
MALGGRAGRVCSLSGEPGSLVGTFATVERVRQEAKNDNAERVG